MPARFAKALAAAALANGVLYLSLTPDARASEADDAKKYTAELKKAKDAKARTTALTELGKLAVIMKSFAEDALPDIYKALDDKDAGVRAAAAACLGACDEPPAKAVPALVKLLKEDKEDAVKIGAARGLAAMGSGAKAALPDLRAAAGDKKSAVGKAAGAAVKAIGGKKN